MDTEQQGDPIRAEGRIDFLGALRAPFRDPAWPSKLGLVVVFQLLVVTSPAVIGWALAYIKAVAEQGLDAPLPAWTSFTRLWSRGVGVIAAFVVLIAVPVLLLSFGALGFSPLLVIGLIAVAAGFLGILVASESLQAAYALTGRWAELLKLPAAFRRIQRHPSYWIAWAEILGMAAVSSAIGWVTGRLDGSLFPGAGDLQPITSLVAAFLTAVITPASSALVGQWAASAFEIGPRDEPEAPEGKDPEPDTTPPRPDWEPFPEG